MGPSPVEVDLLTQLQVLTALESLVLPRMVLARMVLVFLDLVEDAKALVQLDEAVRLSRWCRLLLAATMIVSWRRSRGTPLTEDALLEPGIGCCWRRLAKEEVPALLEVRHRWWRRTALAFFSVHASY